MVGAAGFEPTINNSRIPHGALEPAYMAKLGQIFYRVRRKTEGNLQNIRGTFNWEVHSS